MYKFGSQRLVRRLTALFNSIWNKGILPQDFKHANIVISTKRKWAICQNIVIIVSVRFVKNIGGGSPTGERVEAPQALTCNTNTGVRFDPPGAQIDGDSGGQKNHWEG